MNPFYSAPLLSRRHFLWNTAGGIGGVALAWILSQERARTATSPAAATHSSARLPHHTPRARRIIQIFCCGGVSHLDTFDYKPGLAQAHGKAIEGKGENLGFFGQPGKVMKSPY